MAADMVVTGGLVLERGALRAADVLVRDGRIAEIGRVSAAPDVETVDASGCAVIPGFVNAHFHSGENFNPGLFENLPLDLWFVDSHQVTRKEAASAEEIYVRTLLGALLMLKTGTTLVGDFLYEAPRITPDSLEPVVRAYRDAGLRATVLLGISDRPYLESLPWPGSPPAAAGGEAPPPDADDLLALLETAVRRHHDPDGMVRIGVGPSAPQRCTPELLRRSMAAAREHDLAWHIHVLETRSQLATALDWHGQSFVRRLDAESLLERRTGVVHAVWIDAEDVEAIARTGASAIHCPSSNFRLGDGISPVPALTRGGVNVALGTDGRGCCERLDMLELTRLAASLHKTWGTDFTEWVTAGGALEMATAAGARSLGLGERAGVLRPGAFADLLLVDLASPTFAPLHDFERQLVYGGGPGDLRAVIVGGRLVVDRGRVVSFDEASLMRRLAEVPRAEPLAGGAAANAIRSRVAELWRQAERRPLPIRSYLGPLP